METLQREIMIPDSSWLIADRKEFVGWKAGTLISLL